LRIKGGKGVFEDAQELAFPGMKRRELAGFGTTVFVIFYDSKKLQEKN
jgi:hypothetical protein